MAKDGSRAEGFFKSFEGFVGGGSPGQGIGLSSKEGGQWISMLTEILNKASIEVSKSQEPLEFLHRLQNWPLRNGDHLSRSIWIPSGLMLQPRNCKLTFLQLQA